jgi:hypothetical protein
MARREQAGHVPIGDRLVLARLDARSAFTKLRAADTQQFQDAAT